MSTQYYGLPGIQLSTLDHDEYARAWRALAEPVEQKLGLTLVGFDPDFAFVKSNPHGSLDAPIHLPVWFVRDLANALK